jgi:hypothetical protein
MTPTQFTRALSATRMPADSATARAARMVLVDSVSRNEAARQAGVDPAAVTRAVKRLMPTEPCPHCRGTGRRPVG